MGKKNKFKNKAEGEASGTGQPQQAPAAPPQQQQAPPTTQQQQQAASSGQNRPSEGAADGKKKGGKQQGQQVTGAQEQGNVRTKEQGGQAAGGGPKQQTQQTSGGGQSKSAQQGAWGGQTKPQQGGWGGQPKQPQQGGWSGPPQQPQQGWSGPPQQRGPQQGPRQQGPQQSQQGFSGPPQQRGPPQGPQQSQQGWSGPSQQRGPQQGPRQQGPQQGPREQGPQQSQQGWSGPPQQRGPPQGPQQSQQGWSGPSQQRGPQQGPQQSQRSGSDQQRGQQYQQPQQGGYGQQQGRGPQRQHASPASSTSSASSHSLIPISPTSFSGVPRGTIGIPGVAEANYLGLNLDQMPDVCYHYDVTITPDRPKKFMRPAFAQFNDEYLSNIDMVFDGVKSCYALQKIDDNLFANSKVFEKELKIADSGSRQFAVKVAIKPTSDMEVDLLSLKRYQYDRVFDKPMRALQCLEVVLANTCHSRGVRVGRSFFNQPREKYDLDNGYEMWTGLYQAAILGDRPFLNVDISHKSFPSACELTDWLKKNIYQIRLDRVLQSRDLRDLQTFLRMVNIVYTPPACFQSFKKIYKVNRVTDESASKLLFSMEDGRRLSVAQYFSERGYKLKYPELNCLHVGSTVKANYIPIELCSIPPGQALNKKDGPRQVQNMIKYAATSTTVRKEKIMQLLQHFQHNNDLKVSRFGLKLDMKFTQVPTRVLPSPMIEYYARAQCRPSNGSWNMSMGTKFLMPAQSITHKWALLHSRSSRNLNRNDVEALKKLLLSTSRSLGMALDEKPLVEDYDRIDSKIMELKQQKFDLVFVILPAFGSPYSDTKQSAELRHGVLTQCIKEVTVLRRCNPQTVLNLLLKVNAKLNGTNHKIAAEGDTPLKNVMFMGADVTHPSPDQKHIPSVVGVAASHDLNGACYNMQYRLQQSTKECIEDMKSISMHHLNVYFRHNKKYPDNIIYYRDGVSDGQFPIIDHEELGGIRAALSMLRVTAKITCIIVVKRHHTRFFPTTRVADKFQNVSPGTVVDQLIVHPNEVQFFMVSHQSIQGTAKPTRYNVIVDDAKLDINLLQKLTYNLCHMFPRCNRVVSYPAPAYLAHLVAFRGRVYLEGTQRFQANLTQEYKRRLVNEDFMCRNPMYFV